MVKVKLALTKSVIQVEIDCIPSLPSTNIWRTGLSKVMLSGLILFVLRFYGPVNPLGSCRARSVYLSHVYWTGLILWAVNQYCVHSFARNWQLPFLNQRKGGNDRRKYLWSISTTECCRPRGSNPRPPDHQSDTHPTEPSRPAKWTEYTWYCLFYLFIFFFHILQVLQLLWIPVFFP